MLPHYLATGAVVEIPYPPYNQQYISAAHLEPKAKGGFRLVMDLRLVNTWLNHVPVRFETLAMLHFAPPGLELGISLDLSDMYHHLQVVDSIGYLLTFEIGGVLYKHVGLPMGWLLSSLVFTKLLRPVISFLRCPSLLSATYCLLPINKVLQALGPCFISMYIDNLLTLVASMQDCCRTRMQGKTVGERLQACPHPLGLPTACPCKVNQGYRGHYRFCPGGGPTGCPASHPGDRLALRP